MSFFRRLFRVAKAEGHAAIDKLEDPVKMIEQGLRDLNEDLKNSTQALAQAKAVLISARREADEKKSQATDYEKKAILLLKKAESGDLASDEADRLAGSALAAKEQALEAAVTLSQNVSTQEAQTAKLEQQVKKLKTTIGQWENELKTLKARAKVAEASKKLNQQMAAVDSSGTLSLLAKMKTRVDEDEALAASYGDMAALNTSVDDEINKALAGSTSQSDSLAALKAKLKESK